MHAAPSVNYPVGRSRFAGALLLATWLLGAAAVAAWLLQAQSPGWRHALGLAALAVAGMAAAAGWWRAPAGTVAWDGSWRLERPGQASAAGQPAVVLDLQSHLLLRWRPAQGRGLWVWAERNAAPSHWAALRRAVYSRANTASPSGHQPPVAER